MRPCDRAVVGIALLSLVPAELGGSETYADLVADGEYLACGRPAETSVTATARRRSAGQLKTYV